MKNPLYIILYAGFLSLWIGMMWACSEEADCSMTARPMMQCNLYRTDYETENIVRDTLSSLTITAYGTDSVIVNDQRQVRDLTLPLCYTADSTALVFHYDDRRTDTIIIYQENTPYFLSMDCGYQMKQTITAVSYTRHRLDSIYIANKEAGIYGTENIKLFY